MYQWKDLVSSLVSILKQIVEHRLSKEFDYHRIPAPWVQMNILRILAVLGRGDQAASEEMYVHRKTGRTDKHADRERICNMYMCNGMITFTFTLCVLYCVRH